MVGNGQIVAVIVAVALAALLAGSCVHDVAKSTPVAVDVLILDKIHVPGHYVENCNTDANGTRSCSMMYIPPTWSIEYADERRHFTEVSQATWDALRLGDKKVLRYDLGGGYWRARYNERFIFHSQAAEGLPVK